MNFDVAGPFEIIRYGKKKNITKESLGHLKLEMENWEKGLSDSCGCYIFSKRAGGGITPWYVGQACRLPMFKESLNADNITKYNKVLDEKGTPLLFVIPARTPSGKFRKRPSSKGLLSITFLERWLIATALYKNPDLINNKETWFLKNLHVTGVFNATHGESTSASKDLVMALW
ncbi:hypothetical protein [Desulfobacter postgatei]|uniref:hypothetical protein n=1 Tax=Desulfobacter postgatei TaxID=2293 RepID=UPI00259B88B1|nr:hypothetical protein [uncultured Desulfobacter sp.]